jgi:general secretion pathway protein G
MSANRIPNRRSAFTLLEVLLVLLIIGLLVGMVAPYMFGIRERANEDAARGQIGLIYTACDHFKLFMNDYPANLEQLIVNPGTSTKWSGPYLDTDKLPKDPWGHEYVYEYQAGTKPVIFSMGPDGQPNTTDDVYKEEAQ